MHVDEFYSRNRHHLKSSPDYVRRPLAHPAPSLGPWGRCFLWSRLGYYSFLRCYPRLCCGGSWSGTVVGALVASREDYPLLQPSVPRRCLILVCPPCIYHMMRWVS